MLELSLLGAQVMHPRAVRYARRNRVTLEVASSFHSDRGTQIIHPTEEEIMEMPSVSSISLLRNEASVTITDVPDRPGAAAALLGPVADADIIIGTIVQNIGISGNASISFTFLQEDAEKVEALLKREQAQNGAPDFNINHRIASVSIVGEGMRSRSNIAAQCFRCLAETQHQYSYGLHFGYSHYCGDRRTVRRVGQPSAARRDESRG